MENKSVHIEHVTGKSKKTGKEYNAVKLSIGDWSTLVFPRSSFEAKYIFDIIDNLGK